MNKRYFIPLLLILLATPILCAYPVQALGNVRIVSDSSFYDSLNGFWIVGEVENTGNMATRFTKITATLYDSNDRVVGTEDGYADIDILLPNTKSPFEVLYLQSQGSLQVDHYSLVVSWDDYAAGKPLGIQILTKSDSKDNMGYMHVTGTVTNQGTLTANFVKVIATFYDSNGKVVGAECSYSTPTSLSPNQIGNYEIELIYTQQLMKVASYSLTAESSEYAYYPNSSPVASPTPTGSPVVTPSPTVPEFSTYAVIVALITLATMVTVQLLKRYQQKPV